MGTLADSLAAVAFSLENGSWPRETRKKKTHNIHVEVKWNEKQKRRERENGLVFAYCFLSSNQQENEMTHFASASECTALYIRTCWTMAPPYAVLYTQ